MTKSLDGVPVGVGHHEKRHVLVGDAHARRDCSAPRLVHETVVGCEDGNGRDPTFRKLLSALDQPGHVFVIARGRERAWHADEERAVAGEDIAQRRDTGLAISFAALHFDLRQRRSNLDLLNTVHLLLRPQAAGVHGRARRYAYMCRVPEQRRLESRAHRAETHHHQRYQTEHRHFHCNEEELIIDHYRARGRLPAWGVGSEKCGRQPVPQRH